MARGRCLYARRTLQSIFLMLLSCRNTYAQRYLYGEPVFTTWKAVTTNQKLETKAFPVPSEARPAFGTSKHVQWSLNLPSLPRDDEGEIELHIEAGHKFSVTVPTKGDGAESNFLSKLRVEFQYNNYNHITGVTFKAAYESQRMENIDIHYVWTEDVIWSATRALNSMSMVWIPYTLFAVGSLLVPKLMRSKHT